MSEYPPDSQPETRTCEWAADADPDAELVNALVAVLKWHRGCTTGTERGRHAALMWAMSWCEAQKEKLQT